MKFREMLFEMIERKELKRKALSDEYDLFCEEISVLRKAFDQDVKKLSTDETEEMVLCIKEILERHKRNDI